MIRNEIIRVVNKKILMRVDVEEPEEFSHLGGARGSLN